MCVFAVKYRYCVVCNIYCILVLYILFLYILIFRFGERSFTQGIEASQMSK